MRSAVTSRLDDEVPVLLDHVNLLVAEIYRRGFTCNIAPDVEHPFPRINPCAGAFGDLPTRFFAALASPCQCCSGMRVLAAAAAASLLTALAFVL